MKKSDRPFGNFPIEQLCRVYARHATEPQILRALQYELQYRKPSKTEALRTSVQRHFEEAPRRAAAPPQVQPVIFACVSCSTKLRLTPVKPSGLATCPRCSQNYKVLWQGASCLVTPHSGDNYESMTAAQACKIIGVTESAPWEPTVKKAARALMQQLHPDKCATAPAAVQRLVEAEFKRIQAAATLLQNRDGLR